MALGGGRYDEECIKLRTSVHAEGVAVLVFGGDRGSGFTVQLSPDLLCQLPQILRDLADHIEQEREQILQTALEDLMAMTPTQGERH